MSLYKKYKKDISEYVLEPYDELENSNETQTYTSK
jgi:hypothetical protein